MNNMSNLISSLNISKEIIDILKSNNIFTLDDLWKYKRQELKKLGLKDSMINQIVIKMQLIGLDLDNKSYEKNRLGE